MQAVGDDIMLQHSGKAAPAAMEAISMQERMASARIRCRSHGEGSGSQMCLESMPGNVLSRHDDGRSPMIQPNVDRKVEWMRSQMPAMIGENIVSRHETKGAVLGCSAAALYRKIRNSKNFCRPRTCQNVRSAWTGMSSQAHVSSEGPPPMALPRGGRPETDESVSKSQ